MVLCDGLIPIPGTGSIVQYDDVFVKQNALR